jgi:hypothetical protein
VSQLFRLISGSLEVVSAFKGREEADDIAERLTDGIEATGDFFLSSTLSFEKAISIGFGSGE